MPMCAVLDEYNVLFDRCPASLYQPNTIENMEA